MPEQLDLFKLLRNWIEKLTGSKAKAKSGGKTGPTSPVYKPPTEEKNETGQSPLQYAQFGWDPGQFQFRVSLQKLMKGLRLKGADEAKKLIWGKASEGDDVLGDASGVGSPESYR